jgi:hypothetical protein
MFTDCPPWHTVPDLGSIPPGSDCSGTFEPEGVDYDTATVYEYQQG